jgi:MFS family permease
VAWADKITIACCCISIPLFAIFIFVEMKIASHPFAPGHIILNGSLFSSYVCNFFTLAAYMSTIFYAPLYLQVVAHLSATSSGLLLIPPLIFSVSGSIFGGQVMQRTGKYYYLTLSCLCLSIVGSITVLLSASLLNTPWGLISGFSLMSFGGGSIVTTTLINVIANANPKDQAIATACTYLFRSLGSVVGVSLGSTAVQQSLRMLLRERLDGREAEAIVDGVRKSLEFIKSLDPKTREVVVECYRLASSVAFGVTLCFACLALLSALWIREKKLSRG